MAKKDDDCIEQALCEKCQNDFNRRIVEMEKAIPLIHEKINKRLSWPIIVFIFGIIFTLIGASFSFTKDVKVDLDSLKEQVATDKDLNKLEATMNDRFDRLERQLDSRR